jgi:hypothetical protein
MEGKKIRSILDIPEWFDLKKYDRTSEFTASEWAYQLAQRRNINWLLNRTKLVYKEQALSLFEEIKYQPTFPHPPRLENNNKTEASISAYVKPLKCGLAHALGSEIEEYFGLNEQNNLGLNAGVTISEYYERSDSYMKALVPLIIDLNGSDVDIENDFRSYLSQIRSYTGIEHEKTHITPRVLDKLYFYQILPYQDLMIWSKLSGLTISYALLIDMLFPAKDDEKYITKTIKPFNEKINLSFIRALESYVP